LHGFAREQKIFFTTTPMVTILSKQSALQKSNLHVGRTDFNNNQPRSPRRSTAILPLAFHPLPPQIFRPLLIVATLCGVEVMHYLALNGLAANADVADRGEHGVSLCLEQTAPEEILVRQRYALRLQFRNRSDWTCPENSIQSQERRTAESGHQKQLNHCSAGLLRPLNRVSKK
jgi:hypothetical protein